MYPKKLSARSKRRRVQEEIDLIYNQPSSSKSSSEPSNNIELIDNSPDNAKYLPQQDSTTILQNIEPSVTITNISKCLSSHDSAHIEENIYCYNNTSDYISQSIILPPSLTQNLANWAVNCNVPLSSVNSLLSVLKPYEGIPMPFIPKDARTLLNTPQNLKLNYRNVEPGIYFHFGLKEGIHKNIMDNLVENISTIKVAIGVDGLPLAKSSGSQFWPILAYIMEPFPLKKKNVFLVGLYHGYEKPKDSDCFMLDFVSEAIHLSTHGIKINNKILPVVIHLMCCDAPAKSFLLKIKGHSGFFSCTRCHIEGDYLCNRVCFPYSHQKMTSRTHANYLLKVDEDHHTNSDKISIIVDIPGINVVETFSLDYMHLVVLGVMRKLILLWISKGPLNCRINSRKINELSASIISIKHCITSDFARKLREIQEIHRWKATELRLFLIYIGPIVLSNIISLDCYNNFHALNISMIILLSPDLGHLISYAQKLLEYFVKSFDEIYGSHLVSHNIHGLLHICDDYKRFGPLDDCSCFPFENFMKELKSMVRKHEKPLQQVVHRYKEKRESNTKAIDQFSQEPILKEEHSNGPLLKSMIGPQFSKIIFNYFIINIKKKSDSIILTSSYEIVECLNIAYHGGEAVIIGLEYLEKTFFYDKPLDSKKLNIYKINNLSNEKKIWKVNQIKKKMMIISFNNQLIALPILHSDK